MIHTLKGSDDRAPNKRREPLFCNMLYKKLWPHSWLYTNVNTNTYDGSVKINKAYEIDSIIIKNNCPLAQKSLSHVDDKTSQLQRFSLINLLFGDIKDQKMWHCDNDYAANASKTCCSSQKPNTLGTESQENYDF